MSGPAIWRNPCLPGRSASSRPSASNARRRLHRVRTRQLVDGDNDGRLAIQAAHNAVVLSPQLAAGAGFDADNPASPPSPTIPLSTSFQDLTPPSPITH